MKKFLSFAVFALMLAASALTLTACGDDDDDASNGFSIVGTWYEYEADVEGLDAIYIFNEDKTGTLQEYYEGVPDGLPEAFTYELNGSQLTINVIGEDEPWVMNISIKSATEFTYTDGYDTLTFKKQS